MDANIYSGIFSKSMFDFPTEANRKGKIEELQLNEEFKYATDAMIQEEILKLAREQYRILNTRREINKDSVYDIHTEWYKSYREMQKYFLKLSDNLPANLESLDVVGDKIAYWKDKKESWFLVRWIASVVLFFLARQMKKIVFFSAVVSQLMQMLTNRAFFSNFVLHISQDKSFKKEASIEEVLRDSENYGLTSITRVKKPNDAKKDNGNVNEVYFTEVKLAQGKNAGDATETEIQSKNTGTAKDIKAQDKFSDSEIQTKDVVVKKGDLFKFAPKIFKRWSSWFRQEKNMGNFASIFWAEKRAVSDSTFRQFIAEIVADYLGFDCIVHTEFANDEQYGLSVMMDKARGQQGYEVWLCLDESEKADCERIISEKGKVAKACVIKSASQVEKALELSIVDFICYQADRHAGNFFVDIVEGNNEKGEETKSELEDGKSKDWVLTGIDNDYCCLVKSANYENLIGRKIPFLTPRLRDSILAIDIEKLCTRVAGFMRGERVDLVLEKFRERVEFLKQYAQDERRCPMFSSEKEVMDNVRQFIPQGISGIYVRKDNPISAMYYKQQMRWNNGETPNSSTDEKEQLTR